MFFSKVVLLAISLAAISVLATPHALHHHALHRRAVAARVASSSSNSSAVAVKRRNSRKCLPPSSSAPSIPGVTAIVKNSPSTPSIVTSSTTPPPPPPTSTPVQQPPKTTSTANVPSAGGNNGPFSGGDGTFFDTGLGACGMTNVDTDLIVAVSMIRFDAVSTGNSNTNPLCGKKVSITFGGVTQSATVVDRCVGCAENSLDMTPTLFQGFAPLVVGRIHDIVWEFTN